MWQVEDIIRVYECSLSRIRREYISQFDYTDEQKEEMVDWYGNLIRMMNEEGKRQGGHLQINQVIVTDLIDLHRRLLQNTKFPFYSAQYYKVLPFIVELRRKGEHEEDEIQVCLNALYGVMLLRLQHKDISPDTTHAIQEITTFIGMLSDYYIKDRNEGLQFEED